MGLSLKKTCLHESIEIAEGPFGPHTHKKQCASCQKFMGWHSIKTDEEKKVDQKKHIQAYYRLHPELDKFKKHNPKEFKFPED